MRSHRSTNEYIQRALSYFQAVARLEKRYQFRAQYRQRLLSMAEGTSLRPLGTVGGGSLTGREELMARLADLELELAKEMSHLQAIREQTWNLFSQLSHPMAGQLLEDFYLCGTTLHVIAAKMGYAERTAYKLKEMAMKELGKLLEENAIEDPQPLSFSCNQEEE